MSIPDKFLRIARHKLGELKDWVDQVDEEREARAEQEEQRKRVRSDAHDEARRELDEALSSPPASGRSESANPIRPPSPQRTPDEIMQGVRAGGYTGPGVAPTPVSASRPTSVGTSASDPLAYHFRLLGLEPGTDYVSVQTAYNRLAARCDPSRFIAGSPEESQAREIRQRLDASFKALRDELDTTARRFDLLEFDAPPPAAVSPESLRQKVDSQPDRP